jgi:hypothetical protein
MRASVRARPFSRDITLPRIPICRRTAALPTKDQVEPSARGKVKAGLGALPPTRFPARVCIRVRYSGLHPQKGILSPCRDGGIPSPTVRQFRGIHPSCAATVTCPWGKTRGYREISPLSCRSCSSRCSRRCWYSSTLDQNFPRTHNRSVPRSRYNTAKTSEPDYFRCSIAQHYTFPCSHSPLHILPWHHIPYNTPSGWPVQIGTGHLILRPIITHQSPHAEGTAGCLKIHEHRLFVPAGH